VVNSLFVNGALSTLCAGLIVVVVCSQGATEGQLVSKLKRERDQLLSERQSISRDMQVGLFKSWFYFFLGIIENLRLMKISKILRTLRGSFQQRIPPRKPQELPVDVNKGVCDEIVRSQSSFFITKRLSKTNCFHSLLMRQVQVV